MAYEPIRSAEVDLPKSRGAPGWENSLFGWLEESRWFRPALVLATATLVGLVLAPQWARRSYPTNPSLVGSPATADIKAEYDDRGDIVDEATTRRLRAEAVAKVRRVYDFDSELGQRTAERVREAFTGARAELDAASSEHPGSPTERAELVFERDFGEALTPVDADVLARAKYDPRLEEVLGLLVLDALAEPVVADPTVLVNDGDKGIVLRQLSSDSEQLVEEVRDITDAESLRKHLAAKLDAVLRRNPEGSRPAVATPERNALLHLAASLVQPTLTFNRRDTEAAKAEAALAVPAVTITVKRGQMIIRDGEVFTERHLLMLRQMARYSHDTSLLTVAVGGALLVLMLIFAGISFGGRRRLGMSARDALFLATLFAVSVALGRLWLAVTGAIGDRWEPVSSSTILYLLPVAAGAMVARLVLRLEAALVFGVVASLVLGLMADGERLLTTYALVGAILGATFIGTISRRGDILRAGIRVGIAQAVTSLGMLLFSGGGDLGADLLLLVAAFVSGVLSGFVALAVTPVVEVMFKYTTDLELLELANLNHPALKELIVQAPGTYHHSIIVGSLVEAAAEAIGANALLAKVMAYYHDLGKGCNALYFIENQRGNNPHDKLKPSMSAMIIRRHVTDGLELAEKFGLGPEIRAGIAEHHGTTLIQYFYHRAVEDADADTHVNESEYRYPGQKPQTRESALVMLGDSVEAASRSLADPTPARLRGLVHKIINTKFTDGQLEECDLTLRDLHTIAKAFMKVLGSIYHHRVEYPEAPTKRTDDDTDSKSPRGPADEPPDEDRPDNIRRLGLTGR